MTYLARTVITKAYYLSSIVSRGFQSVSGEQVRDGLDALNEVLAIKSADKALIPYFREYNFTAVIGQEKYFVPDLIEVNSVTFNLATNVRQSMERKSRTGYFAGPRIDNVNALPLQYRIERVQNGSNIYLYFSPADRYPIKIWGKFGLLEITDLNQDLSLTYDAYYRAYLHYALADYLTQDYGTQLAPSAAKQLQTFEAVLKNVSPFDFTMSSISAFGKGRGLGWADANIGHGWTTS